MGDFNGFLPAPRPRLDRRTLLRSATAAAGLLTANSLLPAPPGVWPPGDGVRIAFLGFTGMTVLDLVGPWQVIRVADGKARMHVLAADRGDIQSDSGMTIGATATLADTPGADVIVVAGAANPFPALRDRRNVDWLREHGPRARYLASVCTGALLLAEAGLLTGRPATTHWAFRDELAARGALVRTERVVRDGSVITSAGVSAGMDMALHLSALLWGEQSALSAQTLIEYAPEPPFRGGSPENLPPRLEEELRTAMRGHVAKARAGEGQAR
ncbi:transcriptional regulator GlxA family with amidase domain [Crossiella equi]|uniref:Transcriptional regulator GlxA family with amidase domain n=1 Tax=Crossiella equi TaxID=130796 RepID=A0ABS5AL98_9PSEU|nr:DJ-1/PfpI family protein [Crossiella equi]MBP2477338.1 transcriptional regulator GlxA family with amidase domain [Crossiella equi]